MTATYVLCCLFLGYRPCPTLRIVFLYILCKNGALLIFLVHGTTAVFDCINTRDQIVKVDVTAFVVFVEKNTLRNRPIPPTTYL